MTKPKLKILGKGIGLVVLLLIVGLSTYFLATRSDEKIYTVDTLEVKTLITEQQTVEKQKVEQQEVSQQEVQKQQVKESKVETQEVERQKVEHQEVRCQEVECQCAPSCLSGQVCQSRQCVRQTPACQNECSYIGQRRCAPDCVDQTQYQICGNYDNDRCLEWSRRYTCLSSQICENGQCVPKCTSHRNKACYNNDVYWYNSCNRREGKYQECGSDSWTSNYRCSGDWVQREKRKRGCSGSSCYNHSQWKNYQNCAASGKVCQSGQCVSECTSHYTKKCYNNDVYWYNSCNRREGKYQECGSDSWDNWSMNYCFDNDVYRKRIYYYRGCSEGRCYDNSYETKQLIEECDTDETCQAGECLLSGCPPGGPGPNPP